MVNQKEICKAFLNMCVTDDVHLAYDKFIHKDFTHHNQYYKPNRASLLKGMIENNKEYPTKKIELLFQIEEKDMVTNYSIVKLDEKLTFRVVHIFRFHENQIIEAWDIG